MRRALAVVAVLTTAVMLMTTPAAATSHLAVASAHTDDTDFSNATTLDNVTISGSGTDASVALGPIPAADTAEDGDIDEYGGDTGFYSAQQDVVLDGAWSIRGDTDGVDAKSIASTGGLESYPDQGDSFDVLIRGGDLGDGSSSTFAGVGWAAQSESSFPDGYELKLRGNDEVALQKRSGGSLTTLNSTSMTTRTNETYRANITWESDGSMTVTFYNDSTGDGSYDNELQTVTGKDTEFSDGGLTWMVNSDTGGQTAWFDAPAVEAADRGVYVSQTHPASNVTTGWTNLTLDNATAEVTWKPDTDGDGTFGDGSSVTASYSSTGNKTVDLSGVDAEQWRVNVTYEKTGSDPTAELHDEGLLFDPVAPTPDNASATPDGVTTADRTVNLSINISDVDFESTQGDTVSAEFVVDGSTVGTDTRSSDGTVWVETDVGFGDHTWQVTLTDDYGESRTSETFTFSAPSNMTVFNESAPETPIDGQAVTATFYELDGDKIFEKTTTDGNISLENIGTETFAVQLETSDYANRQVIIKDVTEQRDVWLLNASNSNVQTVNPTFQINDETGQFDATTSRVYIRRGLNISGNTTYRTIAAEEVGTDGYTETLEADQRYRIIVENQEGDRRVLGKFSASDSQTYTLTVEELTFNIGKDGQAWAWGFNHTSIENGNDTVSFRFNDPEDETEDLDVVIYERGNRSNELHNQTYSGPLGELKVKEPVPASSENAEWVVEFTADRNGDTIEGKRMAGPLGSVPLPTSDRLIHTLAIGFILMVGGLASQVNAPAVGLTVSGTAGIAYYIGWLPGEVAGGMIALAMLIPVLYLVSAEGEFS